MFLESILFSQKLSKISKTVLPCSGDLVSGQSSRLPPVMSTTQGIFATHWWVLGFSRLRLVTCSQVKAPIARVTPKFLRLLSRLPLRWNFQSQKTLRKIFQKFHLRCLAACPGNLNMTWFNRENHAFYPLGTVFKTFQFSFEHF